MLKPLTSIQLPLAVAADLDPTNTSSARGLPALLRVHCLLRRGLLVPEQFLLFNPNLLGRGPSALSRSELLDFLQHAPMLISQHSISKQATCEDHIAAALEEDHPFLIGVDPRRAQSHARLLDHAIHPSRRVGINTPTAEQTFPERFRGLAPRFGIPHSVTAVVEELATRASERPGRNESRSVFDSWNRNDVYLALTSSQFDRHVSTVAGVAPDMLRIEPSRSTLLACARAAYLSVLGDQLAHVDQDVLLWVPGTYDLSHSTVGASKFETAVVRALLKEPQRYDLPLKALMSCSWKDLAAYLREDEPATTAYFQARLLFFTAPPDEKLARLEHLAVRLHAHLRRAASALVPRRAAKSTVEVRWHARVDRRERAFRLFTTVGLTGLMHHVTPLWVLAGIGHSLAEMGIDAAREWETEQKVVRLASTLRASWYSSAGVATDQTASS